MSEAPCIGVVAGEASGDRLGAGLIEALLAREPDARFVGVAGPEMRAAAGDRLHCLLPAESLAMNGFAAPLRRAPEMLRLYRRLLAEFRSARIDAFVGIDFNVFNLMLERRLRRAAFPVVHYVSPSVYAWRRGRVRTVAASADLLLTLYPFEPAFYAGTSVDAVWVGHPLADELDASGDRSRARAALGLAPAPRRVLAVLPGSRLSELELLASDMLAAAVRFSTTPGGGAVEIVVAVTDGASRAFVEPLLRELLGSTPEVCARLVEGRSREVLAAADLALVKSGTGTLEAMLLGTPMVVPYRLGALTYALISRLVYIDRFALPNILAERDLVPEFIQDAVTPDALARALVEVAAAPDAQRASFERLGAALRRGASARAADAVLALLARRLNRRVGANRTDSGGTAQTLTAEGASP